MKKNFTIALACLIVLVFSPLSFGQDEFYEKSGVTTIEGPQWAPGEIIVKFKRGVSQGAIQQINVRCGTSVLSISERGRFKRLRIPRNKTVEEMVAIYNRNPNVVYAEPNFFASALMTPNDPYYSYQWHLYNNHHGGVQMEWAWDIQTGTQDVIVAVIDTGVAYENYRNFRQAPDLTNTSFVPGYDFVNKDSHPNDDKGHGTHVTGTIAQSTNNNLGVAGVAFGVSIMPVKTLNSIGSGTYANISDGIYFAADHGADVINLSLGGSSPSVTLEEALAYAYNNGVTIVCAAGNNYQNGNSVMYPAAYDSYCIAVGATRYDETRAYYSNTGSYVDIAAPGGDLTVDQNGDGYGDGVLQQTFGYSDPKNFGYWFYQGTSMAAPHVAGVAALVIANGITAPDNVRAALESTAEDAGEKGRDDEYGYGIVDADAALNYSPEPIHDVAVTAIEAPNEASQGDLVSIYVTVENQGAFDEIIMVSLMDTTNGVEIGSQTVFLNAGASTTVSFNWYTANASTGSHILEAEVSAVSEETDTDDNSMTTTTTINLASSPAPMVEGCVPADGSQGERLDVIIYGENFQTGAEVSFGAGIAVQSISYDSYTEITCKIMIFRKAKSGPRNVTVTNPDGKYGELEIGFTVTDSP